MDKLIHLVVLGVVFCAVFQEASAMDFQTLGPGGFGSQRNVDIVAVCANKLLDERFSVGSYKADKICRWNPEQGYGQFSTIVSSPQQVKNALYNNELVVINLKFDENGDINASDQNQDEFISQIQAFYNDSKWRSVGGTLELFGLQFGDDTEESQDILSKIFANQALSKALENSIVTTASKFLNLFPQSFAYVGEFNHDVC